MNLIHFLKLKKTYLMNVRKIADILYKMSDDLIDFPIYNLVDIIISYVFEMPTNCAFTFHVKLFGDKNNISFLEIGELLCIRTSSHQLVVFNKEGNKINGCYFGGKLNDFIKLNNDILCSLSTSDLYVWKNQQQYQIIHPGIYDIWNLTKMNETEFVSWSNAGAILIWKLIRTTWTKIQVIEYKSNLRELIITKNGDMIMASKGRPVELWRRHGNEFVYELKMPGPTYNILSILEIWDGSIIINAVDSIINWDFKNSCIGSLPYFSCGEILTIKEVGNNFIAIDVDYANNILIFKKSNRCWELTQELKHIEENLNCSVAKQRDHSLIELKDCSLIGLSASGCMNRWRKIEGTYQNAEIIEPNISFNSLSTLTDGSIVAITTNSQIKLYI